MSSSGLDLIIVGAPRSGTNILRDSLCRLPGFRTWPCDEINYIWRRGNARWPSDELPRECASSSTVCYIRKAFDRRRWLERCDVLVEKTCANSLRVPFVDRVLPQAKYVFIHRAPLDAVASAVLRWQAPLNLKYTLAKARFVPVWDLPYYGIRFLRNRLHRLTSEERLASWGPRPKGIDAVLRSRSLVEACAVQWRDCLLRSVGALREMPSGKVHAIEYEAFVRSPQSKLAELCCFLGREQDSRRIEAAVVDVNAQSIGKWRQQLSEGERLAIEQIAGPARARLGKYLEQELG